MTVAMTQTTRTWKKRLRTLATAELIAVTGGIVGPEYSTGTVGNPEDSNSFTGGVRDYLPAIQR